MVVLAVIGAGLRRLAGRAFGRGPGLSRLLVPGNRPSVGLPD